MLSSAEHLDGQALSILQDCYLFSDLSPAELVPLVRQARPFSVRRGSAVYLAGDRANAIYVVLQGKLHEVLTTAEGQEMTTELLTEGDVFGEPGVFARERDRIVSVLALEDSHVVELPRSVVVPFLFSHPPAMHRLLEAMVAVLREEVEHSALAHFASVRDRVAVKLAELAELQGVPHPKGTVIAFDLPQSLLASLVAATRPNVNQAIGELVATGDVVRDGRRLVVGDPSALRQSVMGSRRLIHRRNQRR